MNDQPMPSKAQRDLAHASDLLRTILNAAEPETDSVPITAEQAGALSDLLTGVAKAVQQIEGVSFELNLRMKKIGKAA